jgi:mono/diheme cytochrome c family protein
MPNFRPRQWAFTAALLALLLLAETSWLAYPLLRDLIIPPEQTAVARGRAAATELGCFTCHGPLGRGGVPNPGSEYKTVPSFHQGTIMMFAKNDEDLRAYILDGAPAAKLDSPTYQKAMAAQAIRMPAYRDVVSDSRLDDLVAYLRSASELLYPPEGGAAESGGELAQEMGCFSCHGEMGGGGLANPGSLKGYIPGFYGPDFAELVRDDEELRAWIAAGGVPRLSDDALASVFLERQRIKMPAYKDHLSAEQIDALVAYVRWIAGETWQTLPLNPE